MALQQLKALEFSASRPDPTALQAPTAIPTIEKTVLALISFDLDDTLWDAGPVLWRAEELQYAWLQAHLPRVTAALGIPELQARRRELAREQPALAHDFTQLRLSALRELCRQFDYPEDLAPLGIAVFVAARSQVVLYPEVDAVLRALALRYRLVALTNGNTDLVRAGVADYFEFALSPADTGTSKPDPRMFEAVWRRAGVAAESVVHVGDEPLYDIEGAHRARLASVWVNRRARVWPTEYRPAYAEITTLTDLPAAIERLAAESALKRTVET